MSATRVLAALASLATRRPRSVLLCAVVLSLVGAGLALRLHPTAASDNFVARTSATYKATQAFYRDFGEEPIELLVKGDLQKLVLSADIDRLLGLEGCLSGNVPASALAKEGGRSGPCAALARAHTVKVVFGPGTFINESAEEISGQLTSEEAQARRQAKQAEHAVSRAALEQHHSAGEAAALGKEASKLMLQRFAEGLTTLALRYGLTSRPSLENPNFVQALVFDNTKRGGTPKKRFAYLFPSRDAALVSVRLKAGLSESQRQHTIGLIREAIAMPQWRLTHGESYLLTGEPVIVSDLTSSITDSLTLLLLAALIVMALTLALIFRVLPRLLPLAIALCATAISFGGLSLIGASLTVASVAVLPVLIGLAVDYAIQFQSRVQEAAEEEGLQAAAAVRQAASRAASVIGTAGIASGAALLVLLLSPVPMVRGFGLLLVAGIVIALLCAFGVGSAVLALTASRPPRVSPRRSLSLVDARLGAAWRGARELLMDNPVNRLISQTALRAASQNPGRVLLVGVLLAAAGWGLGTQTPVQTDISKLVPQNTSSLENLKTLERASGVGGQIDLMVSGPDLTNASVIRWMASYEKSVLAQLHYSDSHGCGQAQICPAFSLPDLFQSSPGAAGARGRAAGPTPTQAEVNELLKLIPPYFSQDVISPDRRVATIAFGIRLMGLSQQQQLIERLRASLRPPKGISAQFVGLPVLAAQSAAAVASNTRRLVMGLAGLAAVALVLLVAFGGERRRALVPLVPVVLATGWSALVLFLTRVPLNPMSVTLAALVTAISTEFSVLLCERHRQERNAGHDLAQALELSYRRTGAAVAASGVTAIAGFGVLVLSNITMLRDFGLVTLIDLSVSLLGVLLLLPSALVFAERERPRDGVRRGALLARLRPRGRARHEPA